MSTVAGATMRIGVEQGVPISEVQLRAALRDTAACLRAIRQNAAWDVVARSSGDLRAYAAAWDQAAALIEQSAEEDQPPPSSPTPAVVSVPRQQDGDR